MTKQPTTVGKKCLISDCENFENFRRGLCQKHYLSFTRMLDKVAKKGLDVAAWEESLQADGLLESDGRSASNPFADSLAVFEQAQQFEIKTNTVTPDKKNRKPVRRKARD